MFVLAYRYRRPDDTRTFYPAKSGQPLRITGGAPRLVCEWHNSAQGSLVCRWRETSLKQADSDR